MGDGSLGAADVVGVDTAHLVTDDLHPATRLATEDDRQAALGEQGRQWIIAMQREQQHAIDVLRRQVMLDALTFRFGLSHRQPQLQRCLHQHRVDATDDPGEERLAEDPLLRFGHDQGHRIGPLRHQGARGAVGDVPEFLDGLFDRGLSRGGHLRGPVDDAGDRSPAYPRPGGNLVQRRSPRRPRTLACPLDGHRRSSAFLC
jgi:hypothetical protein